MGKLKIDEVFLIVNGKFYAGDMEFTHNPVMAKAISKEIAEALKVQLDDGENKIEIIQPRLYFLREKKLSDQVHAIHFIRRRHRK